MYALVSSTISLFENPPWFVNIDQSVFVLIENTVFAYLFLTFTNSTKKEYWLKIIVSCFLVLTIVEYLVQGINTYRQSICEFAFSGFTIILGIFVINKLLETETNPGYKRAKLLIVIPIILYKAVRSYLNILLLLLFNPANTSFFIKLFEYLNYLDLVVFISYTISFLCLPKKKKFL